jgi:hemoglobin
MNKLKTHSLHNTVRGHQTPRTRYVEWPRSALWLSVAAATALAAVTGCGTRKAQKQANQGFFTSGSREADQRATQRMAKNEQLAGSGEGAGEEKTSKAETGSAKGAGPAKPAEAESKLSLYDRLGGDRGISAIVEDFMPRALQDPRVNWARTGVKAGRIFHTGKAVTWNPTPQNVATLKAHLVQFVALATGGPAHYTGDKIKGAHANMQISNPEFDAVIGDLKASLDKLRIPNREQKELLAIIESTRPQIVTER